MKKATTLVQVDHVRVLGKTWKLRMHNDSIDESAGITHHATLVIDIDGCQRREHVQDTLLHEIVHAIDKELSLKLSESVVSRLSTVLLGTMKDNPEICRFIFGFRKPRSKP